MYSCFTCNRKKGCKWPTRDARQYNNGTVGFVDPVTEGYDEHLMRDETGRIIFRTPLGKYLCNNVFKFNCRPTDTVWKAMEIVRLKKRLQEIITTLSPEEMREYIEIDKELANLMSYIFRKKE